MSDGKSEVRVRCRAKVNLVLRVLGRREDGYHELDSLLQTVTLEDFLHVRLGGEGQTVRVSGFAAPQDASNLCVRAVQALERRLGRAIAVEMTLHKRIPAAAGRGGGSADAAGAIVALNCLLGRGWGEAEMVEVGAEVGSDVPALILGGSVHVRGRGEACRRLEGLPTLEMVIAKPQRGLSTAEVYRWWDESGTPGEAEVQDVARALRRGGWARWAEVMVNDLEAPVLARAPEIKEVKQALLRAGAVHALLCGSGSAVAGFFAGGEEAQQAALRLAGSVPFVRACRSSPVGVELA